MRGLLRRMPVIAGGYGPLMLLYAVVAGTFAALSDKFLTLENAVHILVQSSAVAVVSIGMTFVLLTACIDLSVGSVMFLTSAVAGSLVVKAGWPIGLALLAMLGVGVLCGLASGLLVERLRMAPFVVTLAVLFIARGLGLWITETRAINLPDAFRRLATEAILGVPPPVVIMLMVLGAGHLVLSGTTFGRQLYALGADRGAAEKAGVRAGRLVIGVYVISGTCAAIGGMITLAQLAAVSPNLGQGRELDAIAAAVLGGTSLFGGRGGAIGSLLGAVLVETISNGLNVIDADPYVYPVITGAVIFVAVSVDSVRHQRLAAMRRRRIRVGSRQAAL